MIKEVYNGQDYGIVDQFGVNEASPNSIPGFKETTNFRPRYSNAPEKKKRTIAKFFSEMARFGMSYEDDVIANMRAIPADKSLMAKENKLLNQDLFTMSASNWKVKANADQSIFEKDWPQKVEALRKLAVQPELEDILDTMTNEAIVYDSDFTYFAEPFIEPQELGDLKKSVSKKIQASMADHYRTFYKMLNWKYRAWDDFKRFLVEGILAWEIVWDSLEKPKRIIGFVPLDPGTLTKVFDKNKWYWVQFKGIQGRERTMLDSQVIYIAFQETNCLNRTSYLERLIRPFNLYRIIEQAQLIWTITNSSFKMKFTIPIRGMNKTTGMQTLNSAMNRYKEDIRFNAEDGELKINGLTNLPFNKEYWMPEGEAGSPQIETLGGDGPELNDNDQLKYFKNQLYKVSKIPLNRFDQESGETWFGTDPTSVARVEIDFARFVTRLRNQFSQIIIKPLQLQLACDYPELLQDKQILQGISLQYHSYNLFEEMMEIELASKRVEFIQTMKESLIDMDTEGNEIKFWSSKFLVQKYLKMSAADLNLNDKMKQEEIEDLNLAGDKSNGYDDKSKPTEDQEIQNIMSSLSEEKAMLLESELRKRRRNKKKRQQEQDSAKKKETSKQEEE